MVSIDQLNRSPEPHLDGRTPELVALDEAGAILETLSSEKRRAILCRLSKDPTNPATLASELDTSVQNVTYHLEKLQTAGLVDIVTTHYSEKGLEMDVYGPASPSIVIDVCEDRDAESRTDHDMAGFAD